ncbi:MAG: hypothetical protein HQL66_00965 [Magnetococcales bacterium]|nr:hypothetical protein [Magnetococcales bacterium]
MRLIRSIPVFAYLLIFYNAFLLHGSTRRSELLAQTIFTVPLRQSALQVALGDVIVMVGIGLMYVELSKMARTAGLTVLDRFSALMVFAAFLAELLLVPLAGTLPFLTLTLMAFLIMMARFTLPMARRGFLGRR